MRGYQLSYHYSTSVPAFRCKSGTEAMHKTFTGLSASIRHLSRLFREPIISISLLIIVTCSQLFTQAQSPIDTNFIRNKIKGLITGTLLGDALGGPIEFQGHPEIQATPNPPKLWTDTNNIINDAELKAARERIYFREYKYILPFPQSYGTWKANAAPGSVTDDSRNKIVLLYMLRKALQKNQWPLTEKNMAKAFLDWRHTNIIKITPGYDSLCKDWMGEMDKTINWVLGSRELGKAYPPERMWNAYPTCYGQMTLPPIAAIYPGQPEKAYLAASNLAYFDNGFAKDMNAALVAGLSVGLTLDAATMSNEQVWTKVIEAINNTDPYNYNKVPWCSRSVAKWFYITDQFVKEANGSPAKLFRLMDEQFKYDAKWEAQVPFVVIFSLLKICKYDPMAALQLSIEWGNDHDTYPQLLGAFIGAIYGPDIFKEDMRSTVTKRLQIDYDENIDEWVNTLMKVQQLGKKKQLVK
jgi:ADP-ribosylglycohydrolase